MDNTVIYVLREIELWRDTFGFASTYIVTLISRCAIASVPILVIVMTLRKTVLRKTVFIKGAVWGIFAIVPFLGKLKAYYEIKYLYKPFILCQDVAITLPLVRALYLIICFVMLITFLRSWFRMRRMIHDTRKEEINGHEVYIVDADISPFAHGLFNPRIVIPESMAAELDEKELDTIILHEETHMRLGHLWIFFLWEIAASLFWINPFLKLCAGSLREDMEQVCDKVVIQRSGQDPCYYGTLLLKCASLYKNPSGSIPAMLLGESGLRKARQRFIKIRDYDPYSRKVVTIACAVMVVFLCACILQIFRFSYPKYQVLPDITVTDEFGKVYLDSDKVEQSGAIERTEEGLIIDAAKLRDAMSEDFPENKSIFFYYDMFMKIPGMGGGGTAAWLEEFPKSGIIEAKGAERDLKEKIAIWLIKMI